MVERWSLSTSHTWETPGPKTVQVTIQRSSGTKILSGVVDVCHFYQMEMFELSAENGGLATIEFDIPNLVGDPNALAVAHREAWYPFPRSVARWAGQTDTDRARVFRNGEASPFFEAPYPPSSGRTWPYMSTVYFAPRSKLTFKLIAPQNGSATFQGFISGFLWKNWGVPMIGAEQKGNMSGCVFDAVGGGVANVVVRVGSPDGKTAYEPVVTSGPDGSFTFIGLPSGYQYRFWPEGRPELGVTVEVSGSTSGADINLP